MQRFSVASFFLLAATVASADTAQDEATRLARDGGLSAIWILANVSYAGMRAQASRNLLGRVVAFALGLPGTLLSLIVVSSDGERAYGVDLPRRRAAEKHR